MGRYSLEIHFVGELSDEAWEALSLTHSSPRSVSSDFARYFAQEIGLLASVGYITTLIDNTTYSKLWRVTPRGLVALQHREPKE